MHTISKFNIYFKVERSLKVVDGAITIFDGVAGVEVFFCYFIKFYILKLIFIRIFVFHSSLPSKLFV